MTGVITSVEFSHATPAGFVAHNVSRNNYAEIAEEMINSSATDVIMGCGHPWYDRSGVKRNHRIHSNMWRRNCMERPQRRHSRWRC